MERRRNKPDGSPEGPLGAKWKLCEVHYWMVTKWSTYIVKYRPSVGSVEGASKNEWVKGASVFNNKK